MNLNNIYQGFKRNIKNIVIGGVMISTLGGYIGNELSYSRKYFEHNNDTYIAFIKDNTIMFSTYESDFIRTLYKGTLEGEFEEATQEAPVRGIGTIGIPEGHPRWEKCKLAFDSLFESYLEQK